MSTAAPGPGQGFSLLIRHRQLLSHPATSPRLPATAGLQLVSSRTIELSSYESALPTYVPTRTRPTTRQARVMESTTSPTEATATTEAATAPAGWHPDPHDPTRSRY